MKKILLATSALVALSGAAAAEITFSGDAQIGLKYDNRLVDGTDSKTGWNVQSRARFTITMTGETDSGLSFGAKFRPGAGDYTENRDKFSSSQTVWIEGAYGKLTVGDVDSAIENAVGDLAQVGNSGLEFFNEIDYLATDNFDVSEHDNKGVLYTYNYGDASFYASFEDRYIAYSGNEYNGKNWSLGASYDVQQYSFGIGYSQSGEILLGAGKVKSWGLMASGDFNDLVVKALYVESKDNVGKLKQYGISADYTMANGVGLQGFYRINDWNDVPGKAKILGLGAGYDLGGGASLNGGIVHIKDDEGYYAIAGGNTKRTIADVGVAFKF